MKKPHLHPHGFTFVELMTVVVIIVILFAILLPVFARARAQSLLSACEANERNIATGLETYAADWSSLYPPGNNLYGANFTPKYMSTVPVCPVNGSGYLYTSASGPSGYTIYQNGSPHQGLITGLPEYSSQGGLIAK